MVRVPLVRVEGKTYTVRPDLSMTPARFAQAEPLDPEARDQIARDTEAAYGLGECLYFYAGFACPDFGDVVLVYEPELSDGHPGNASSFDTGGMFKRYIQGSGLTTDAERAAHAAADLVPLASWRTRLDAWLTEHFPDVIAYLDDTRPFGADPSGRLSHPANDRRAWTLEVRLWDEVALFELLAFAVVRQDFLLAALAQAGAGSLRDRLLDLLGADRLVASGPLEPCAVATSRIIASAAPSIGASP